MLLYLPQAFVSVDGCWGSWKWADKAGMKSFANFVTIAVQQHPESIFNWFVSQVGFAKLKETADDRADIGATIIGAPIVG